MGLNCDCLLVNSGLVVSRQVFDLLCEHGDFFKHLAALLFFFMVEIEFTLLVIGDSLFDFLGMLIGNVTIIFIVSILQVSEGLLSLASHLVHLIPVV